MSKETKQPNKHNETFTDIDDFENINLGNPYNEELDPDNNQEEQTSSFSPNNAPVTYTAYQDLQETRIEALLQDVENLEYYDQAFNDNNGQTSFSYPYGKTLTRDEHLKIFNSNKETLYAELLNGPFSEELLSAYFEMAYSKGGSLSPAPQIKQIEDNLTKEGDVEGFLKFKAIVKIIEQAAKDNFKNSLKLAKLYNSENSINDQDPRTPIEELCDLMAVEHREALEKVYQNYFAKFALSDGKLITDSLITDTGKSDQIRKFSRFASEIRGIPKSFARFSKDGTFEASVLDTISSTLVDKPISEGLGKFYVETKVSALKPINATINKVNAAGKEISKFASEASRSIKEIVETIRKEGFKNLSKKLLNNLALSLRKLGISVLKGAMIVPLAAAFTILKTADVLSKIATSTYEFGKDTSKKALYSLLSASLTAVVFIIESSIKTAKFVERGAVASVESLKEGAVASAQFLKKGAVGVGRWVTNAEQKEMLSQVVNEIKQVREELGEVKQKTKDLEQQLVGPEKKVDGLSKTTEQTGPEQMAQELSASVDRASTPNSSNTSLSDSRNRQIIGRRILDDPKNPSELLAQANELNRQTALDPQILRIMTLLTPDIKKTVDMSRDPLPIAHSLDKNVPSPANNSTLPSKPDGISPMKGGKSLEAGRGGSKP